MTASGEWPVLSGSTAGRSRDSSAYENPAEDWFSKIFHANPVPAALTSHPDGRFLDVNETFLLTFGFDRDQVIGRTAVELGLYEEPGDSDSLRQSLENDGPVRGVEIKARNRAGEPLQMLMFLDNLELDGQKRTLVTAYNNTMRRRAEDELRRSEAYLASSLNRVRALAGRLMKVQDDERRRIARELHETTAQDLAALKLNLSALERDAVDLDPRLRSLVSESASLAEQSMRDVRTLSYLLHPPFLDEVGLTSALRWFSEGFGQRSGIPVELTLPDTFERLPREMETTLFRIVQESLTNIHRHSASPRAAMRLWRADDIVTLEIQDWGRGLELVDDGPNDPARHAFGVGIPGMRERIEQLGGTLSVDSDESGTVVRARLKLSGESS